MKNHQYHFLNLPALSAAALLATACAPEQPADKPVSPQDLFSENCGACHGQTGGGPSLETLRALSSDELRAAIRNHPTAGQIPQRLSADTISNLIDFIESE